MKDRLVCWEYSGEAHTVWTEAFEQFRMMCADTEVPDDLDGLRAFERALDAVDAIETQLRGLG